MVARILLIGMSGTGKSTVARIVASDLGWDVVSMDDDIEARAGMSIPDIFADRGESWFRDLERDVLADALTRQHVVVSTGGGAVCNEIAWDMMASSPGSLVVGFDASADELVRRMDAHQQESTDGLTTIRPMIAGDDPHGRVATLLAERWQWYLRADATIPVEGRDIARIAADVIELVAYADNQAQDVTLSLPSGDSRMTVGHGVRHTLVRSVRERWPRAQRIWLAADENVARENVEWIASLQAEFDVRVTTVPSGETSKSLAGVGRLYDWMLSGGVERSDVVVALGGGVVGDLAGFAAATVLRGIGLVQIPTTLLAMVDSSVGGKTGINHPAGKNLIGAFYQPPVVLIDPDLLESLPEREFRSGFGEIVKHGVIQASTPDPESTFLADVLDLNAERLLGRQSPVLAWVIRQNVALKASVVAADERESTLRQILNFGHTIGHGIEAADYSLLHGEAIAVGMMAAAHIAVDKGEWSAEQRRMLGNVLQRFHLPLHAEAKPATVRNLMAADKKKSAGAQQWVVPDAAGGVRIRTDVTDAEITRALNTVLRPA